MLSAILSKEFCKDCKFCCIFEVRHLWETPEKISHILDKYEGADPLCEVPCPHLDNAAGCTLSDKDKPFECSIWPFRIMNRDGRIIMAVANTCPGIKQYSEEFLRDFAQDNLLIPARSYYSEHPNAAKPYVDYYTELFTLSEDSFK